MNYDYIAEENTSIITHLSLCTGYEGIGMGLRTVLPTLREIAYVEREGFCCANLENKMQKGQMGEAPIFTDVKTFPYEKFRGLVDIMSFGFPCQPFIATSFPTLQKESELCNQSSSSQKTLKGFSVAKQEKENLWSNMSEEHWKKWVTEQRSEYSQRVKLARHISVNESSSLVYPTPSVAGCVEGGVAKNVEMTPTGFKATRENGTSYGAKLRDAVLHQWGTPNTMDHLPSRSYEAAIRLAKSGGRKKREKPGNLREQVDPMMVQAFQDAKEMQWLTPTGIDIERTPEGIEKRKKYRESIGRKYVEGCLTEQVKNWSTPRVNCDNTRPNRKGGIPLGQQVKEDAKSWSTPTQRDYKDSPNDKSGIAMTLGRQVNGWERSQQDQTKTNTNGSNQEFSKKGYLNPNWVEQLMGLPIGWTALDYSEME
jgi:hypothetical protein